MDSVDSPPCATRGAEAGPQSRTTWKRLARSCLTWQMIKEGMTKPVGWLGGSPELRSLPNAPDQEVTSGEGTLPLLPGPASLQTLVQTRKPMPKEGKGWLGAPGTKPVLSSS